MQEVDKYDITVIIPFLNEYEGILSLVDRLNEFFEQQKDMKTEVIFVNDGSTDHSALRLAEMKHTAYSAKVISFSQNFGTHAALRAGMLHAKGEFVTFLYADLQDPIDNVTTDVCKGERWERYCMGK